MNALRTIVGWPDPVLVTLRAIQVAALVCLAAVLIAELGVVPSVYIILLAVGIEGLARLIVPFGDSR